MVSWKSVEEQLKSIGCNYLAWGRTETKQLPSVLMHGEHIIQAVNGYYDGGFALLVITNFRVLVVDKKPFLLTIEDLRYDMIAEVDYNARIITSILHIFTPMRTLDFTSWSMPKLHKSMNYIQQRIMEIRNNEYVSHQFAPDKSLQPSMAQASIAETEEIREQQRHLPQMVPTFAGAKRPVAEFDQYKPQKVSSIRNPYTKVPLLSRRRRYPSFYVQPY